MHRMATQLSINLIRAGHLCGAVGKQSNALLRVWAECSVRVMVLGLRPVSSIESFAPGVGMHICLFSSLPIFFLSIKDFFTSIAP